MELTERKIRILEHIINDYIASAEPIGSRTIARKYDMGLSSATIRNEMSDLEEMGYILAPHASAGRVPSDKGYRLYVDRLIRGRQADAGVGEGAQELRVLKRLIANNIDQIDLLMRETARIISLVTSYAAVVSEPESAEAEETLHRLQLMPMDDSAVLLVTVTVSKKVKNHVIRVLDPPDCDELAVMSNILNGALGGLKAGEITAVRVKRLREGFARHQALLSNVLSAVVGDLSDAGERRFYTGGVKNLLSYPEFADLAVARSVFETLEEKEYLIMLLGGGEPDGVNVVIGQENDILELKGCSVVKAGYALDPEGRSVGNVAILGPTRMNYSMTMSVLRNVVNHINEVIRTLE